MSERSREPPRAKRLPTIRSRLALLVLACVLPASVMIAGLISYDHAVSRAALAAASMATARALMSAVDRDLTSVRAALTALSTSPHLASDDFAAFYAQAEEVLKTLEIRNILLMDEAFQVRVNTLRPYGGRSPEIKNPQLREVLVTGQPATTDIYLGPVSKLFVVAVAVPVLQSRTRRYVLAATISPERLSQTLINQKLAPDWIGVIFDGTGTIVARTHGMARFVGTKGSPAVIARMAEVAEDSMEVDSVEGIRILSVFSRSSVSNWTVAIGIPTATFARNIWNTLIWLFAVMAFLLAISLAIAWQIGRRIAEPIHQLAAPALALGSGLEVNVPPLNLREADEVGRALTRASAMLIAAQHKASHDPLTGLANRALFEDILGYQLAICSRTGSPLSIVNIDLDGFKPVNDVYGHATGDDVLRLVAARLKLAIRDSDLAARLGGDEFALILVNAGGAAAETVVAKLMESLSAPYCVGRLDLELSASMGIASYPEAGSTAEVLSQRADEAMYRAKAVGKQAIALTG